MNGRAYDYNLGRFTGVDPFIQFPLNSQSLNPYSYVLNSPFAGTDPTGYCTAETGSHVKTCVNVKANMADGSTKNLGSYNTRSAGDMASAKNVAIPGIKGGDNGSKSAQGPNGSGSRRDQTASPGGKGAQSNGVNIESELTARGARRGEINNLASGCGGYMAPQPKACATTERLFGIVKTGQAAGTDDSGGGDAPNKNLVGRLNFNESGGMELSATYSYKGISDQAAKNFESRVESAWGGHGGNVDLRRAGEGETPDLMLSGITNRQMAENLNLCSCMAGAFIGAHSQKSGVININMGTPLPQNMTMPEHEFGHDLGLKHRSDGVMSYTGKTKAVRKEDLQAVKSIYSK
jgi:hypothetical protein